MDKGDSVTKRQLGTSLRRCVAASQALGLANSWTPTGDVLEVWSRAAAGDQLALTLTEADGHAAVLVQSSLDHADAVARYIGSGSPFLPHSIARTAIEHGLRAMHYLDDQADELTRASRRLNEWLYALEESGRLRKGIVAAKHPGADDLEDEQAMLERIFARARSLGLTPVKVRSSWHVGSEPRQSTMKLAESYLTGGGGAGVPSMVMRSHAAMDHGVETALLGNVVDEVGPHGVNLFRPHAMDTPRLAFSLMGVPLTTINAIRAIRRHYGWATDDRAGLNAEREQERAISAWQSAITEYLDDQAPDRPRTGIFGRREHGQPAWK